jgi:hypothetical protein
MCKALYKKAIELTGSYHTFPSVSPKSDTDGEGGSPRHNILSAGGEWTRPCPGDISSTAIQSCTGRRRKSLVRESQGMKIAAVTSVQHSRLHSPLA